MPATIRDLIEHALAAFDVLALTAEPVEDEWQYVRDLDTVWRARLKAVAGARSDEAAPAEVERALAVLAQEAGKITDPHRAIDWLSTLPQVALAALDEPG